MGNAQKSVNIDNSRQTFNDFVADLSVRSGLNDGAVRGSAIGRVVEKIAQTVDDVDGFEQLSCLERVTSGLIV